MSDTEKSTTVHTMNTVPVKLLIPIDATDRSHWGLRYALQQYGAGIPVHVDLLFVAERVADSGRLRFQTEDEILKFQVERGKLLMEDAASTLREAGIDTQCHIREGNIVFHIIDTAEQLACDQIVLPIPYSRLCKLLSVDVVRKVIARTPAIPVVTVNSEGEVRSGKANANRI